MNPVAKIDPIIWLLTGLVIVYTVVVLLIAVFLKSDGQTFQIVSNLTSGFAGALLMRINPTKAPTTVDLSDTSVKKVTDVHTETVSPKETP